jgi:hypothetical protein
LADDIKVPDDVQWDVPDDVQWEGEQAPPAPKEEAPGAIGAFARGASQGVSLGLGDEMAGLSGAAGHMIGSDIRRLQEGQFLDSLMAPKERFDEWVAAYQRNRDDIRNVNKRAKEAHGYAYGAGEIGGSMPLALSGTGVVNAIGTNAIQGGIRGVGESEATDASGLIQDAAEGAALGGVAGGVGYGVGKAVQKVAAPIAGKLLGREVDTAHSIANEATQKNLSALQSARQPLSREAAEAGRHVENILEAMATMDDFQKQMLMQAMPPAARAEIGRAIQEQVDKGAEYMANRVRPTMGPVRSASDFAEDLASPAAGVKAGAKGLWGSFKKDLKQIPGAQTALAGLDMGRKVFASDGAKLTAYQQMRLALSVDPQRWGRFSAALADSVEAGERAFAATDYLLSQSEPEYRALRKKFDEDVENGRDDADQ